MKEDHHFSDEFFESEHLKKYIAKKNKKNSRLRVGRKNKIIKKNRRKQIFKTAIPLLLLFLLIMIISAYFASPFSKVKSIDVQASQNSNQIKQELPIRVGDSITMINANKNKINQIMRENDPTVKRVRLSWKKHNELNVKFDFYDFHAYVQEGNKFYAANLNGEISKTATKVDKSINVVVLHNYTNDDQVKTSLTQYDKLPSELKSDVKEIKNEKNADDREKVKLILNDGNQVVLKNSQLAQKMSYYPSIKTTLKRPSVVNLEYGAYATPIK